jgi:hypothetical protein
MALRLEGWLRSQRRTRILRDAAKVRLLRMRTEHAAKQDSRRHCCRRPFVELRDAYFGYLNSGAAFKASLVVFIDATHLLSLFRLTFTEAGETAT